MLRILSVNPTGLGSYGNVSDIDLEKQGLIWLHGCNQDRAGTSNGAGKTTLFHAITACLFGRVETFLDGSVSVGDELVNETLGRCCARVVWINGKSQTWRVTLARKWKGSPPYTGDSSCYPYTGTDLYLEQLENGVWVDRRAAKMSETRERCIAAVGLRYERFLACAYLAQGRGFDFLRGSHADRMAILADVVNLTIWDSAQLEAKKKREETEQVLHQKRIGEATLRGQRQQLQMLPAEEVSRLGSELVKSKAAAEGLASQYEACMRDLVQVEQDLAGLTQNPHRQAQAEIHQRATLMGQALTAEILRLQTARTYFTSELGQQRALLEQRMQNYPKKVQLQADREIALIALHRLQEIRTQCAGGAFVSCPTCGGEPPKDAFLLQQFAQAEAVLSAADARVGCVDRELVRYRVVLSCGLWPLEFELEQVEADGALMTVSLQLLGTCQKTALAEAEVSACTWEAERQGEAARARKQELVARRDKIQADLGAVRQYVGQLEARLSYETAARQSAETIDAQLVVVAADLAELSQMSAEYAWMVKNFGDKGVKAWRVAEVCDRLNVLLAEAIGDLDGAFSVMCRPYRPTSKAAKKDPATWTADDVVYEIEVLVQEGGKAAVPLYLYSGGEVSVLAFAFLVAFWRLSDELGEGVNLLLVDEAVGALDSKSAQVVLRFLEGLRSSGKTVLVVSHSDLVEVVNWDATWLAVKQNGLARLEQLPRGVQPSVVVSANEASVIAATAAS